MNARRILTLILLTAFCLLPAQAAAAPGASGGTGPVRGALVSAGSTDTPGVHYVTYEYTLASPSYDRVVTNTTNDTDSTNSVRAYLTVEYTTLDDGMYTSYLLLSVSGYWTILDSDVQVEYATLYYGCESFFPYPIEQHDTKNNVSNHFSYDTGYTQYIYTENGAMGATLYLHLRDSSGDEWTFELLQNIFGGPDFSPPTPNIIFAPGFSRPDNM